MKFFWLLKSEPATYSFSDLLKDKKINWNGVRNFQARNFLKKMQKGDPAIIYHSGDERAAVGVAEIIREAYEDPDPEGGEWVQVDIKPVEPFKKNVALAEIKSTASLKDMLLIKQSRLSCMPITEADYELLRKMGGLGRAGARG